MAQWGFDLCDFDLWPLTLNFCMDITSVIGNNFMIIWWLQHCEKGVTDGRTDRQMDRRMDRQEEVFLELLGRSLK